MKIAYDPVLKRPGCVLLQALFGCSSSMAHKFHHSSWLVAPTDNLKVFRIDAEQLDQLVEITEAAKPAGGWTR